MNIKNEKEWKLEVYRNSHNLCVVCGESMYRTVFSDVPLCKKHYFEEFPEKKENRFGDLFWK